MRFTIDDKHLIKWMWLKNTWKNACSRLFWQKMKSWWGKEADQNISTRSLNLLIFGVMNCACDGSVVGNTWRNVLGTDSAALLIVSRTTTRTRVCDATVVTFSVKCFNPWKLYLVSENIFRKRLLHIFIYSREFNNNVISNGKSYCCNDTYWRPVCIVVSKEYLRRIGIFLCC